MKRVIVSFIILFFSFGMITEVNADSINYNISTVNYKNNLFLLESMTLFESDNADISITSNYSVPSGLVDIVKVVSIVLTIIIAYNLLTYSFNKVVPQKKELPMPDIDAMIEKEKQKNAELTEEKIHSVDPNLNIAKFKENSFKIYRAIQIAWMNFDYTNLKKLTTAELYSIYESQLKTLSLKKQKNIMKDIHLNNVKIMDIEKIDNNIYIKVSMIVNMYDYIINTVTNDVIRGTDRNKLEVEYIITYVKSLDSVDDCPNCGADISLISNDTCPYCRTKLVKNSSSYVMSKKSCNSQRILR